MKAVTVMVFCVQEANVKIKLLVRHMENKEKNPGQRKL